jgi:hypothetical protein
MAARKMRKETDPAVVRACVNRYGESAKNESGASVRIYSSLDLFRWRFEGKSPNRLGVGSVAHEPLPSLLT